MTWQTTTSGADKDKGFHSDIVWNDIVLPPDTIQGGNLRPDRVTLVGNIDAYGFDGVNAIEEMSGSFELLHDYKEGTDLRPHIHWCPSDANSGDVKWQMEICIVTINGTYTNVFTLSALDPSEGVDRQHQAKEFEVINGSALTIGAVAHFRIFRDPTDIEDTYGSDAILLSLGVHYEIDGDGSRQTFTK